MVEQEMNAGASGRIDELSAIEYHLTVVEFDLLWNRRTTKQEQGRMDDMIRLINAFEESR